MRNNQKIGIVTWFNYANPGTAFQAYALQQYINSLQFFEAEILTICNTYLALVNNATIKVYAKKYGCFSKLVQIWLGIKAYNYCSFQRKHINMYPRKLDFRYHKKDCSSLNDRYDWVILGSDQLWNLGYYRRFREDLFLAFVSGPKKGAYAPSIGVKDWPDELKGRIKELLSDFSFIGVREKQAVEVVQPLAKVPVHWSLDPTFLLDRNDWSKIARKPEHTGEYIFEYCIIKSPELRVATEKLAAETGLPIIESHGDLRKHVPSAIRMPHPSADTWLGYLMNAKYVVTDSFHGCAFCVNTNRNFYAIVTSNGSRIHSMLELFGLQNRVLTSSGEIDPAESINWDAVNQKLEERRKESQDWLKSSLLK